MIMQYKGMYVCVLTLYSRIDRYLLKIDHEVGKDAQSYQHTIPICVRK